MARPNPIRKIMQSALPTKTEQRKFPYRPQIQELEYTYDLLNRYVFDNALNRPEITTRQHQKAWGLCEGDLAEDDSKIYYQSKIILHNKWYCPQWMVTILAHEMVHQYQWDVLGPERYSKGKHWLMSHGPSFFMFKGVLEDYNIALKVKYGRRRWFETQDLFAC